MIFMVFAANVIGGISLNAGRGTMFGALTGVVILVALVPARVTAGEAEET
jgi:ribose/xylose/arabinose/galactoside ABC-type transport system permease subunit